MDWLRFYTEIVDDAKIRELTDKQYRIFTFLLCFSQENYENGSIGNSISDISWRIRYPQKIIKNTIDKLIKLGIIGNGKPNSNNELWFLNWNKRQYKSDTSTTRTKRFRERQREQLRNVPGNAPETETETETDNIKPPISPLKTGDVVSIKKTMETQTEEMQKVINASGIKPKEEIPYLDIVQDFNTVTGRNIQTKNKKGGDPKFFRQIKKLWIGEGMRFEDFQKVHRVKHKEWSGTDMAAHLEPETLYRPGNFEKYLRQAESPALKPDESWCYNSKTGEIFAYTAQNEPKDMPELTTGLASYSEAQEWALCHKFCPNCKKPREFIDGRCQVCGAAETKIGDNPDGPKTEDKCQSHV
jgi:uncharacterized phage protein (TIGR02220 family)